MAEQRRETGQNEEELAPAQHPEIERPINRYFGRGILLFLASLSVVMLVAAAITALDTVIREFPRLWQPADEYASLQRIIENILLIAIAAELALLLLSHRTSAAVEVVIFIIARKMVNPTISAVDLALGAAALAGLIAVRHYYLSGETQRSTTAR
jgi:hypothetical protein